MISTGNALNDVLKTVGLTAYENEIRRQLSCKSHHALLQLTDEDLHKVGMRPEQRSKLLLWLEFIRKYMQPEEKPECSGEKIRSLTTKGTAAHGHRRVTTTTFTPTVPYADPPMPPVAAQPTLEATSPSKLAKVRLCNVYDKKKTCHFGRNCKFAHEKSELRVDPRDGLLHDEFVEFERIIKELSVQPLHSCVVFGDYLTVDQHQAVYTAAKRYQLKTRSFGHNADRCVVVYKGELSGETHPCLRVYGTCNYGQACTWSSFPRELCLRCLKDRSHSELQCDNTCDLEALMKSTRDAAELRFRVEDFMHRLQERAQATGGKPQPVEVLTFKMALAPQQRKVVYWSAKMLGLEPLVCGTPPHCGIVVLSEPCTELPAHPCHRVYGKCNFKKCIFEPFPRMACLRCLKGKSHDVCDTDRESMPHSMSSTSLRSAMPHHPPPVVVPFESWRSVPGYPPQPIVCSTPPPVVVSPLHLPMSLQAFEECFPYAPSSLHASPVQGFDPSQDFHAPSLDLSVSMDIAKLLGDAEQEMMHLIEDTETPDGDMTPEELPTEERLPDGRTASEIWERYTADELDAPENSSSPETDPGAKLEALLGVTPSEGTPPCDILLNAMLTSARWLPDPTRHSELKTSA